MNLPSSPISHLFVLSILFSSFSSAEINGFNVEPESWWAGMHNSQLQLLVYGEDIHHLQVKLIKASDIKLLGVDKTSSHDHLFIKLDLANAKPQTIEVGLYDQSVLIKTFAYTINPRAEGSRERQGFSNKDVIYLITPDRFVNGDPDNDNHPQMLERLKRKDVNGRHGGDIQGIENSLDYLAKLGITQLWINPLLENNQDKYSYHGYSTTDHYRIDPRFGSNEDYRQLITRAKEKGIGIIKDIVVNHIGSNHRWMKNLPSSSWINGYPAAQDNAQITYTTHRRTTVQDPYAAQSDHSHFVDGWFVDSMPDLNQQDPLLATYLIQNSIWWIEYAGLSGIREDTYSYADKAFLSTWSNAIMSEYPNFNIVGEEWTSNPITVSYWQAGKRNQDGVYVYFRFNDDDTVMVIINKNDTPVSLATARFHTQLDGFNSGVDVITHERVLLNTSANAQVRLHLPARGVQVLSLQR